jgi:hypothetical protein
MWHVSSRLLPASPLHIVTTHSWLLLLLLLLQMVWKATTSIVSELLGAMRTL